MSSSDRPTRQLTDADVLRSQLDDCERALAASALNDARALLLTTHAALTGIAQLEAQGMDLRPEQGRLDSVVERITQRAPQVIAATGGQQAYAALRSSMHASDDELIWSLDALVAARRRRAMIKAGMAMAICAIFALAAWLGRGVLFPPDPVGDASRAALRALGEGSTSGAVAAIDDGLQRLPGSPELLIWRAVIAPARPDAQRDFASAEKALGGEVFLLYRAGVHLQIGQPAGTISDTSALLAINPASPEAYMVRASAYEVNNDQEAARADLQQAATLAEAQGKSALDATARVRLGQLLAFPQKNP